MATYKVPQDVEAEDKLLGPFTFRQFIYLVVVAIAGFLAYGLSRIFWGLALIPTPIMLFFLILALPLKKDQPMETYLTAVVRFWMKPRLRLWEPEGTFELVEITAPQSTEFNLTKEYSGTEASQRLSYLSQIVDTGGWASRGLTSAIDNVSLSDTVVAEAQTTQDMFDSTTGVAQNFDSMIDQSDTAHRKAVLATMQQASQGPPTLASVMQPQPAPPSNFATTQPSPTTPVAATPVADEPDVAFNPYPSAIHQRILQPHDIPPSTPASQTVQTDDAAPQKQAQAPSEETLPPDIMRLATSKDLSISTIAREAERLHKKHLQEDEEVIVSLR